MATYTDNYNLTKPTLTEVADVRVINGNMDTVDEIMHGSQVSIADAYDPTQTYDVDDIVMHGYLLYKCITAVSNPEAFDPTKWERTTAVAEGGGGGNANERVLHKAQYDALSPAEQMNGTTYYIDDWASGDDYSLIESVVGTFLGQTRYRKVIDFGSLPQNSSKSVAHGISNIAYFTRIEAVAYESTYHYYLPIPFVDNGNSASYRKSIYVDDTNVNIQTYNSDATDYKCFVILEYVKEVE